MNNIAHTFGSLYHPKKAFLIYEQKGNTHGSPGYIESYDIAPDGSPINAHPLSVQESTAFAKALSTTEDKRGAFLKPNGLLPKNLLYLKTDKNAYAIWYTPKQMVKLLFREDLGIPSGDAPIPALIWKATKDALAIYAITDANPSENSALYHAPFFNIYKEGRVCMGNVQMQIPKDCGLEDFMQHWQHAFFNSYFSHMLAGHNPVKGNMVQLWTGLVNSHKSFPLKSLILNKATLKNLIQ